MATVLYAAAGALSVLSLSLPSPLHCTLAQIPASRTWVSLPKVFLLLLEPVLHWMPELLRRIYLQVPNHANNKLCIGCLPFLSQVTTPLLASPGITYKINYFKQSWLGSRKLCLSQPGSYAPLCNMVLG